eukprot:scaffold12200_cov122-Cylindrotheca_fusiformis.AAC.4
MLDGKLHAETSRNRAVSLGKPNSGSSRRSIFSEHWTAATPNSPNCEYRPVVRRSKSPKCVLQNSHFQLFAETETRECKEVPANTYEQVLEDCENERERKRLRPYESRPLACWFTSLPTLVMSPSLAVTRPRFTQSDSSLHTKQNIQSLLRKGRFSGSNATTNTKKDMHVSFESSIQIHRFSPPMNQWAEKGWSSWFGV